MDGFRKLAHEMLDELDEKGIFEVIQKMRKMKGDFYKIADQKNIPLIVEPTGKEIEAIKKAEKDGESYTHEDVFGENDYA